MIHTFAYLFVLLLVAAIPAFSAGLAAGWFRWSVLAGRRIGILERQNAALRAELQRTGSLAPGQAT